MRLHRILSCRSDLELRRARILGCRSNLEIELSMEFPCVINIQHTVRSYTSIISFMSIHYEEYCTRSLVLIYTYEVMNAEVQQKRISFYLLHRYLFNQELGNGTIKYSINSIKMSKFLVLYNITDCIRLRKLIVFCMNFNFISR